MEPLAPREIINRYDRSRLLANNMTTTHLAMATAKIKILRADLRLRHRPSHPDAAVIAEASAPEPRNRVTDLLDACVASLDIGRWQAVPYSLPSTSNLSRHDICSQNAHCSVTSVA